MGVSVWWTVAGFVRRSSVLRSIQSSAYFIRHLQSANFSLAILILHDARLTSANIERWRCVNHWCSACKHGKNTISPCWIMSSCSCSSSSLRPGYDAGTDRRVGHLGLSEQALESHVHVLTRSAWKYFVDLMHWVFSENWRIMISHITKDEATSDIMKDEASKKLRTLCNNTVERVIVTEDVWYTNIYWIGWSVGVAVVHLDKRESSVNAHASTLCVCKLGHKTLSQVLVCRGSSKSRKRIIGAHCFPSGRSCQSWRCQTVLTKM